MKIDFISDINKDNYYILDYDRIDLYMIKIAWWNAAFFALYAFGIYYFAPAALYPSPFSWRVVNLTETLWTVAIALFAAFLPAALRGRFKNHYLYRFITANALITFSYLLVFISGGSIEWHFHFFVIFALLTLYADCRHKNLRAKPAIGRREQADRGRFQENLIYEAGTNANSGRRLRHSFVFGEFNSGKTGQHKNSGRYRENNEYPEHGYFGSKRRSRRNIRPL